MKASKPEPFTASNTLIKPHEHQERPQLNPINFFTEYYFNDVRVEERIELPKEKIWYSEYLKNVVTQFLAPERINDARSQLLPVLCTILSLTSEEKTKVEQYLNTQRTPGTPQSEWSGYFGGLF